MPFNQKPQKFNAKINAVTIGSGDKTVTIGGENSFPFYTFDAPTENTAKIGVEISDLGLDEFSEGVKAYYEGATTMAEIAQKAAAIEGADFKLDKTVYKLEALSDSCNCPTGICSSCFTLEYVWNVLLKRYVPHFSGVFFRECHSIFVWRYSWQ